MVKYDEMPPTAKVWVYQAKDEFQGETIKQVEKKIDHFIATWSSHNQALKAWGTVMYQRFIIFMVDEHNTVASGCSIDKSVAFIKSIETLANTNFFDRWNFAYLEGNEVKSAQKEDFEQLYKNNKINDKTIVFNNLVKNKAELEKSWKIPLAESWHKNFI